VPEEPSLDGNYRSTDCNDRRSELLLPSALTSTREELNYRPMLESKLQSVTFIEIVLGCWFKSDHGVLLCSKILKGVDAKFGLRVLIHSG
jgi:hypothetical protein